MESCSVTKGRSQITPLNKENALEFANLLYSSDKEDGVHFVKLCNGYLVESGKKTNKKKLHCAVGQAYFHFVSTNLRWAPKMDNPKLDLNSGLENSKYYTSKWEIGTEGSTAKAIDSLVEVAILKKPTDANKQKLANALRDCVDANDRTYAGDKDSQADYIERAKTVAQIWKDEVVPLLK